MVMVFLGLFSVFYKDMTMVRGTLGRWVGWRSIPNINGYLIRILLKLCCDNVLFLICKAQLNILKVLV